MDAIEPEVTTDAPIETTIETPVYFGADGTLNDGWKSTLPEGYRDEKSLPNTGDAKILAKMFVDTKRMVGKNVIAVPSDISTESEWEAYHKADGRPETVADYNLATPEGFPDEIKSQVFPEGRLEKWQERFFKAGVSKKGADAFISEFANDMLADYQNMQQLKEQSKMELVSELATEYGAAFDQKMHLGDIAIEEGTGGDPEMKEALAYLRDDPVAVKMLVNLGEKFSEGKPPSYSAIPTPGDYQDQIDALQADPLYMSGTQAQRMKIANKIMALRKLQKPEPANT